MEDQRHDPGPDPGAKAAPNKRGVVGWLDPLHLNLERWAYVFQRVTGLAVLAYVVGHIGDTSFFVGGPFGEGPSTASWSSDLAATENVLGHVVLVMVVLVVVYHGINGMRLILAEYGVIFAKPTKPDYPYRAKSLRTIQRHLIWVAIIASILAALYTGGTLFG
ncbi:MAG TPA: succinate dehydrogenase [Nitrososphaerales archaeon]|nr:succinate dehydrogenase [Nitrososphaerales archaeon]